MVKFIATDLDGTLLDGERRLPEEIFPLIAKLKELGVLFAPASGRQYANLKKLFEPVADDVLFICENGALIKYRGKTLHVDAVGDEADAGVMRGSCFHEADHCGRYARDGVVFFIDQPVEPRGEAVVAPLVVGAVLGRDEAGRRSTY